MTDGGETTFSDLVNRTSKRVGLSAKQNADLINEAIQNGDAEQTTVADKQPYDIMDENMDLATEDKDWDTDLENEEPKEAYDHSGKTAYIEACRRNDVVPVSFFLRHMQDYKLRMKHHGLGPAGIKPICVSMVGNTSVLHMNMSDNWLGPTGGYHVCEMLKENCFLQRLDLSENRLGPEFARHLPEVFSTNITLTRLVLSGNELGDASAPSIAEAILLAQNLETLILSHNSFGVGAGVALGPALAENTSLKHVDLSWNNIRRKGAVSIAQGIKNNVLLHKVNLAWNGFGLDGATAVADALKHNSVLEHVDLSNNRITAEAAVILGRGLAVNESLKTLMLGKNPMQSAGCYAICVALLKNPNCQLELVDFSDILVNPDYRDISRSVEEHIPNIKLKTGGDGVPKKPKVKLHPMIKLRNFISKNNLRLQDVFAQWDKDNSMSVTHEEFTDGIKELGMKLTEEDMQTILDELDKDGDGEINYCELVIGHADFSVKEKKMHEVISIMKSLSRD